MNTKSVYSLISLAALICLPMTSIAQPDITVDPLQIDFDFNEFGQAEDFVVTIANDGDAELRWQGNLVMINEPERQGPQRDDPGELLGQFDGINARERQCSPIAMDWDNEWMWVTTINPNLAVAYSHDANYENFEEVRRINPGQCTDGAWANGLLYLPPFNTPDLNRFSAEGQNLGVTQMPFQIVGIAADDVNDWLFLMNGNTLNIHVFQLNQNGAVGEQIGLIDNHLQFHNNRESFSIEWVQKHRRGQLWMTDPDAGRVHQILVDTDDWTCVEEIQNFVVFPGGQEEPTSGVAHDGFNLWVGGFVAQNIRIYDDGFMETYWIAFEPTEGELGIADDMDIIIMVTGMGLIGGVYEAELHILSNDPDEPDVVVNIRGTLIGVPDLAIGWPEEAGFPDVIDFNRFGDVWLEHDNILPVTIRNIGTDDLEVNEVFFGNQRFRADPSQFVLAPNRRQAVTLTYTNNEPGLILDTLRIVSNDPDEAEIALPVRAEAFLPPIISVDPQVIEVSLGQDETDDHTVSLSNDGESLLRWRADLEIIQVPGRDAPNEALVTIEPDSGAMRPDEAQDIIVHFELVELDSLPELISMMISSNDPENPTVEVQLRIYSMSESEAHNPPLPDRLSLSTIYPNPFNSTAEIEYSLPVRSQAKLLLLDLQGRELLRLSDGMVEAGTHRLTLEAGQLPAGTYLIRLRAGSEIKLAKAVVVK